MKKKQIKELATKSLEELVADLKIREKEMIAQKIELAVGKKKSGEYIDNKKMIARIKTIITEKQFKQILNNQKKGDK